MMPPGAAGAIGGAQKLPGNVASGPGGPGGGPAASPGGGAGNEAAADAMLKAMIPGLHKALGAYPVGSKKYAALLNAIRALTSNFGKESQDSLVPSAIEQMAMAAKSSSPLPGATPPGIAAAAPGAGAPPGGAPPSGPPA